MRRQRGPLPEDPPGADNYRLLRYVAKFTINPAITHGIAHVVGSLEPGKLADIVLWPVAFFGVKPKMVIKGGMIVWSLMGDPNASIPTPEPVFYRPMFGALGRAARRTSVTFVSQAALDRGLPERLGLERPVVAVRGCRTVKKADMVRNARTPRIDVDPETYVVRVDGEPATAEPAARLSLAQLYFIV